MCRTLTFQQITDSRFMDGEKCLETLHQRIDKIKKLLSIDGVSVEVGNIYILEFSKENNIQYRVNFKVTKDTKKIIWNDIYSLVNSVSPVPYKFI